VQAGVPHLIADTLSIFPPEAVEDLVATGEPSRRANRELGSVTEALG
jgi:hypothetical protein